MTDGNNGTTTTMESSQPNNSNDDEISQLKQSLEEARQELSEAKKKIARLEAENAELRRRAGLGAAGNKNGQADTGEQGMRNAQDPAADGSGSGTKSNAEENEEKKDDETPGNDGIALGMDDSEETNASHEAQHISLEESDTTNNAPTQDDTDKPNDRNNDIDEDDDSAVDSENDESVSGNDDSDNEEENHQHEEPPTSPADDIRLRAARTLIWADSAIKRAEALKEQQAAAESTRGSVVSGETPRSASHAGRSSFGVGNNNKPPSTVRIAQSVDTDSQAGSDEDDASFLSDDDESDANNDDSYSTNSQSGQRRRGPLARIGRFLEDKMDDVADRLVAMDTSDNRSLHSGSLAGGGASGGLPPRSPPGNYKYCNDAMKKKMGGDDDASTRTPTSVRSGGDGDGNGSEAKPKPMMNEAMMRLSSEKKKRTGFGSRLFNG